jgi:hypothetical protein
MADITQQLAQMGALLTIVGVPGTANAGQQLNIGLQPALQPLTFTDIVLENLSLDFIAKQVVFTNKDFTQPGFVDDPAITKILPLFNLAAVPPSLDPSGVPGLIGKLKGQLPVPVPTTEVPGISVTWEIQDGNGNTLSEGTDFLAPGGLTNVNLDIAFLPAFTGFDGTIPPPSERNIIAHVVLTAGTASFSRDVGPVKVLIPTIPFPKVLALTLHTNFLGAALIMVPDVSAIQDINHIKSLLQPVRNAISTLTSIARFAEMLLGIDTLVGILESTNKAFSKDNPVNNLNDIDLITRPWYQNDTEAEDELSAFVYISPPPSPRGTDNQVEMCNARSLGTSEGKFTVSTGLSFVALCGNLHTSTPSVIPTNAVLTVNNAPGGWRWAHNITIFGDELSSIRFL